MEPRGIRWSPEQFVEDRQVVVQRPYRREPRKGRVTEETAKSGQTDGGPEGLDRDTATMELECEAAVVGAKAAVRFREVFERRADRGDVGGGVRDALTRSSEAAGSGARRPPARFRGRDSSGR